MRYTVITQLWRERRATKWRFKFLLVFVLCWISCIVSWIYDLNLFFCQNINIAYILLYNSISVNAQIFVIYLYAYMINLLRHICKNIKHNISSIMSQFIIRHNIFPSSPKEISIIYFLRKDIWKLMLAEKI